MVGCVGFTADALFIVIRPFCPDLLVTAKFSLISELYLLSGINCVKSDGRLRTSIDLSCRE
jgi:hypothetical protein